MKEAGLQLSTFYDKPCFGTYKCWIQVKARCPVAVECKLKRQAEDMKGLKDGTLIRVGNKLIKAPKNLKRSGPK